MYRTFSSVSVRGERPKSASHHKRASDERQQVPAHGEEDQQAVEVQHGRWSSGPGQGGLGQGTGLNDAVLGRARDAASTVTHPQEMTRVEELLAQIVKEVKPDEEEYVDAHPHHLWDQHTSVRRRALRFLLRFKRVKPRRDVEGPFPPNLRSRSSPG